MDARSEGAAEVMAVKIREGTKFAFGKARGYAMKPCCFR
jgi:hypothetical protein